MSMRIGSAPDSWGVWFGHDDAQPPWTRFLDEVAQAGYRWIELGPYGYLPTDAGQLAQELERRELRAAGTFVSFDLADPRGFADGAEEIERTCALLRALESPHLVLIDALYTDLRTGELLRPRELDAVGWGVLVESTERVRELAGSHGLDVVFHPHADTHVELEPQIEQLLEDVPELVLCLDVGHFAYRAGGDPVAFFRRHADRIRHLHLKSVDEGIRDRVRRDETPFCQAVAEGMFVEPSLGVVDFPALRDALLEVGYDGFAIAEQDMYPAAFDRPLPIARRTFEYFRELGLT
jgi:inosose dehydratase